MEIPKKIYIPVKDGKLFGMWESFPWRSCDSNVEYFSNEAVREKVDKVIKLADAMCHAAQYLTTDSSRLQEAMEDYHKYINQHYHKEE